MVLHRFCTARNAPKGGVTHSNFSKTGRARPHIQDSRCQLINQMGGNQTVPKCFPSGPREDSKWARRLQDGSKGAKMVSMRLEDLPQDSQDGSKSFQGGSYGAQQDSKRGEMASKGSK